MPAKDSDVSVKMDRQVAARARIAASAAGMSRAEYLSKHMGKISEGDIAKIPRAAGQEVARQSKRARREWEEGGHGRLT